ncbi:carboxypeptidase-like regulatory domain-containing protein [Limnohabitans sp.]|uniref:carboxypeptidase-like regulatory domain-containing protein n=1 Tax=Limnohabitans sp. TaxID=1907725 RepID=UPI00286F8803|nr:carboxypeptidase-like regulatory domain-containing protein [Limnohabitans sp.]
MTTYLTKVIMRNKVVMLVAAALISGCALPKPELWTPMAFDEVEYGALKKVGSGVVRGSLFAKTVGGDIKIGAGEIVRLYPVTKYTEQLYREQWIYKKQATHNEDARYITYVRQTTTGIDGKFEFTNVPPGEYFAFGGIYWKTVRATSYGPVTETQGGLTIKRISVSNGKVTDVALAP